MTIYMAGHGRRRRPASKVTAVRWLATLAAFVLALAALSSGLILLDQARVDTVTTAPALTLIFAAGAAFAMMIVAVSQHER